MNGRTPEVSTDYRCTSGLTAVRFSEAEPLDMLLQATRIKLVLDAFGHWVGPKRPAF